MNLIDMTKAVLPPLRRSSHFTRVRETAVLQDGTQLSIHVGMYQKCFPQEDDSPCYESLEVCVISVHGYYLAPSEFRPYLVEGTYLHEYVPTYVVYNFIQKHGGIRQ
jgi:hypothetical protein